MADITPRVRVPETAAKDQIITIKTLIQHVMESGHNRDAKTGDLIPRRIINRFVVAFNGITVFEVDLGSSVSANPYFAFRAKVPESGEFTFTWFDDDGSVYTISKKITVV